MQTGEIYKIHIDSYSHNGYGVGRVDGFVVMVKGLLRGEVCDVIITEKLRNHAFALPVEMHVSSEKRRTPFCQHFSECGGCSLQYMSPEEELTFKQDVVNNAISRIGGIFGYYSYNIIGMDHPYAYRNSGQYHCDEIGCFGFYQEGTNQIADVELCPIQSDLSNKIYKGVRAFCKKSAVDFIKHIIIRVSFSEGQAMLILVLEEDHRMYFEKYILDKFIEYIKDGFPECVSIYLSIKNPKNNHKTIGERNILIFGEERILDRIGDLKFYISPQSFFQVNPLLTEILYNKVMEFAGLTGNESVYDLYCGTGTISLFLASKAKMVTGVENVPSAIEDAKQNAELNGIMNVKFVQDKAEDYLCKIADNIARGDSEKCDVIVVDPPRAGCHAKLLNAILTVQPARIVYVSCNPGTLARDLKVLTDSGYEVRKVQPVNMFPWGAHVETIVLMSKVEE